MRNQFFSQKLINSYLKLNIVLKLNIRCQKGKIYLSISRENFRKTVVQERKPIRKSYIKLYIWVWELWKSWLSYLPHVKKFQKLKLIFSEVGTMSERFYYVSVIYTTLVVIFLKYWHPKKCPLGGEVTEDTKTYCDVGFALELVALSSALVCLVLASCLLAFHKKCCWRKEIDYVIYSDHIWTRQTIRLILRNLQLIK